MPKKPNRIVTPDQDRRDRERLVLSLLAYVDGDDVGVPRVEFLQSVRNRIDADLKIRGARK